MKFSTSVVAVAVSAWCFVGIAHAQTLKVTTTQVPTSTIEGSPDPIDIRSNTAVTGMNDKGQFIGTFGERDGTIWNLPHAFLYGSAGYGLTSAPGSYGRDPTGQYRLGEIDGPLYADAKYHYLDLVPALNSDFNAKATTPYAINNAGMVVGKIAADEYNHDPSQAFTYDSISGSFSVFSVPGAISSSATGINNRGLVVGNFVDSSNVQHGFLLDNGVYTVIDSPLGAGATLRGINDKGAIVGSVMDATRNVDTGFVYQDGQFTYFNIEGTSTYAAGINNAGAVVGWIGVTGTRRGFLYQKGVTTILDLAGDGVNSTYAYTIDKKGVIGGMVENASTGGLGFFVTVRTRKRVQPD